MEPLPLQGSILRSTVTTLLNRVRSTRFAGTTVEAANEAVNQDTLAWTIQYKPLTLAEKEAVLSFLLTVGYSKYFTFSPRCVGDLVTYTVRMTMDSLQVTRRKGNYFISFNLSEEIYLP
jgi:hypothetical protein